MNYSNTVLEVMTKQLGRIENLKQVENDSSSTSTKGKPPIKPIYKLINVPQKELEAIRLDNDTDLKIEEIRKRLEKLGMDKPFVNTIEINKLKAYPNLRNYYPRPSLADVQYEERGNLVQNSFLGNKIFEWNIDGMSDQQILDITCQMTMAATAHKTRGCSDKSAALAIIQGFTGQLKGWWDNLCTDNDRLIILNSVKNETNQEDTVSTLIYIIIQNFIGDPNIFKNRVANQLTNLYYPTMSNYRWYKDAFLSQVTLREDGFATFWKEKFIVGQPKLFPKKVRMNLERHYGQPIGYESLTYVCTDFKLQNKIRKESSSSKKELGTFCHQYGVEAIRAPGARNKKKQTQERSYNKSYKQYRKSTY
ncbi:hypothetical protein CR513_58064, partial [Mucuna pruriens]